VFSSVQLAIKYEDEILYVSTTGVSVPPGKKIGDFTKIKHTAAGHLVTVSLQNSWKILIQQFSSRSYPSLGVTIYAAAGQVVAKHMYGMCGDGVEILLRQPGDKDVISSWKVTNDAENLFLHGHAAKVLTKVALTTKKPTVVPLACNTEAVTVVPFDPFIGSTPASVPISIDSSKTSFDVGGQNTHPLSAAVKADVMNNCEVIRSGVVATIAKKVVNAEYQQTSYTNCVTDALAAGEPTASRAAVKQFVAAVLTAYPTVVKGKMPASDGIILCPSGCFNRGTCRDQACVCNTGIKTIDCSFA